MYWRRSTIDADNNKLTEPYVTLDLYLSTDDYAPYIKFDIDTFGGSIYPWCVMRPFGTKYGGGIVNRFAHFYEAYNFLSDLLEKETGT